MAKNLPPDPAPGVAFARRASSLAEGLAVKLCPLPFYTLTTGGLEAAHNELPDLPAGRLWRSVKRRLLIQSLRDFCGRRARPLRHPIRKLTRGFEEGR